MNNNPLIVPILNLLQRESAMSEHELLTRLESQGDFEGGLSKDKPLSKANDLALFQKHFLIMNALYYLQEELVAEQWHLHISPLKIFLSPISEVASSAVSEDLEPPALKAYYGDLKNLEDTDEQGVQALLTGFWQRYLASDKRLEAYQRLELPVDASWLEVKQAYRRLAKQYHPDHGGDASRFIEVRAAYEVLEQVLT